MSKKPKLSEPKLTDLELRVLRYIANHGGTVDSEISAGDLGLKLEVYYAACVSLAAKGMLELGSFDVVNEPMPTRNDGLMTNKRPKAQKDLDNWHLTQAQIVAGLELGYLERCGRERGRQLTRLTRTGRDLNGVMPDDWLSLVHRYYDTRTQEELDAQLNGLPQ